MGKELSPLSHLQPVYASYTDLPKGLQHAIRDVTGKKYDDIRRTGFDFTATATPDGTYSGIQINTSPILDGDPNASKWHHVNGLYNQDNRVKILRERHPDATDPNMDFSRRSGETPIEGRGKHRSVVKGSDLEKYIPEKQRY